MHLVGHLLFVRLQKIDRLLERFEHVVRVRCAIFDGHQMPDNGNETVVVAVFDLFGQSRIDSYYESSQVVETIKN